MWSNQTALQHCVRQAGLSLSFQIATENFCSPFFRSHIFGVPGKKPVVPIHVLDTVLPFAVLGFVKFFHDFSAAGLHSLVMPADVFDENCEALSPVPKLRRTLLPYSSLPHHDAGVTKQQLSSRYGLAITIVFGKAEDACQPVDCFGKVLINDVREKNVCHHGAVSHFASLERESRLLE